MSVRTRQIAANRAKEKGYKAFKAGIPHDDCPYKFGEWGLGWYWSMGWNNARQEADQASPKESGS